MNRFQPKRRKNLPVAESLTEHRLDDLVWNFGSWLTREDSYSDAIISSRIRLARNLQGHTFPSRASASELKKVRQQVLQACKACPAFESASFIELATLSEWECKYFVERRLASPQLVENRESSLLVVGEEEAISVMVNEEDHLRMQCLVPGLSIDEGWSRMVDTDESLEDCLDFSYSKEYGYLTSCPTNLGTGLRVSVFVHLPALALKSEIEETMNKLPPNEIAIRGFYGEGSESIGNIYQISNQLTLGRTEQSVIKRIYATAQQLVYEERKARERLMTDDPLAVEDSVYRALGILQNARIMSSLEAMNLLSTLRLGKELGMLDTMSRVAINQLMIVVQPAHLQKIYNQILDVQDRDAARAEFLRRNLPMC